MKTIFGLCILVILFLALSGCTQPAPSAPAATAVPTTESAPVAATSIPAETTAMPAGTTAAAVTAMPENVTSAVANVTMVTNETAVETTVAVPTPSPTPVVTDNMIHMRNNAFVPSATTVLPGTGIVWLNDDTVVHTVKASGANEGMFNSGDIAPGGRWDYTFGANTGSFTYTDPNYPGMNGTITIQKGRTLTSSY